MLFNLAFANNTVFISVIISDQKTSFSIAASVAAIHLIAFLISFISLFVSVILEPVINESPLLIFFLTRRLSLAFTKSTQLSFSDLGRPLFSNSSITELIHGIAVGVINVSGFPVNGKGPRLHHLRQLNF